MVDAEGRIGPSIVPANVQDRDVLPALEAGQEHWPSLRLAIVDGVVRDKRCEECCSLHGMHREVVPKEPDQSGFVVLERRWVVERISGRFSRWGGPMRERAGRLDVAPGHLTFGACLMALTALVQSRLIPMAQDADASGH